MSQPIERAVLDLKQGLATRNRALVNSAARLLIAADARLGEQWQPVANALANNGEITLALGALERFRVQTNAQSIAGYAKVNLLYRAGRLHESLAELDRLAAAGRGPANDEQRLSNLNFRASIALLLDWREEARTCLMEALERDPRSGQAWLTLSEIADFRGADAGLRERLEAAFELGASIPQEGFRLAHAAARMREQVGDHAGAFAAYQAGADLFRASSKSGTGSQPDLAAQSTDFPLELIERVGRRITVPHDRVIFVSGLPRSGTTLVEQILVSHSDVAHGEELSFFRILAQDVGGIDAASFSRWLDGGGDPNALVELYLHLATERFGPDGRFVDKTVEAGNYMGLLLALFPKAPVFWMRRDPLDNGWSAFRTAFAVGAGWSWDLQDIGKRLAQEERMIAHWSAAAGDRISFIDYEELVRRPEAVVPRIAGAAGLSFEEAMLRPHETRRKVTTASVSQVRQPINLKGLGVADPYSPWLRPMIDAYEEARPAEARSSEAPAA